MDQNFNSMNKNPNGVKKTLIITSDFPPKISGLSSYISNFAKHLPSEKVIILAPKQKDTEVFDKECKYKVIRKKLHSYLLPNSIKLLFLILWIRKKEKIEQIHIHHTGLFGWTVFVVNKIFKIPYFIFFHGVDLELLTSKKTKRLKLKRILKNTQTVVVNSEFSKNKLIEKMENVDDKKIKVVYSSPADFFLDKVEERVIEKLRAKLALRGKKVILTVGNMNEGKGYPHMIRVLPKILKKVPNLVWVIIGEGKKEKLIVEMVQKNSLQNVVRFLGQVDYQELPKYYQLADLFVLLTHEDEDQEGGWGTVFLEAGASSVPVVAGKVGGVNEAVSHLITGILVNPYEDMQVISAISELLLKSDYAKEMGEKAKTRVENIFTWEKQISKLGL